MRLIESGVQTENETTLKKRRYVGKRQGANW